MITTTEPRPLARAFQVANTLGLHARPAAAFVQTASRFGCNIIVQKDGARVSGKSVIGLLCLGAGRGTELTVHAHGHDASQALAELERLFEARFGELE